MEYVYTVSSALGFIFNMPEYENKGVKYLHPRVTTQLRINIAPAKIENGATIIKKSEGSTITWIFRV